MAIYQVLLGTYNLDSKTHIDALNIVRNRRISQSSVIRNHMTIIPEGKFKPLKIRISGTIASGDYTELRTAIADLMHAVHSGDQKFTLDDERYAVMIDSQFNHSFIGKTNFIAKYTVTLLGELPFWLDESSDSDTRIPTSGDSYSLNNGGQLDIPARITITAVSGDLVDNIQFESKTKSLLFKYRGTLADGNSLIIDKGFADDNKPTYVVQADTTGDFANFEGDFMVFDPGDNEFEYTGGGAEVVIEWRKMYYA